jgi:molybdate transport system ATP-binding protein
MIKIDIHKNLHGSDGDMSLRVELELESKSFVALSGKSGSGKSTFLRILAGLEEGQGYIEVDGEIWLDDNFVQTPQNRSIGFVFQDYALFDNMSVENNLLYVNSDKELSNYLLEITELTQLKNRSPSTLSGGQKQRVSICRAMMRRPKLLLMDEPLSALDPLMRSKLQDEIISIHKEFGTTTIIVSHEPSEIYKMTNRMIVLNSGTIVDDGNPKDILLYTNGTQKFSFTGEILDIKKVDVIYIAIISIGQQIVEVVISSSEAQNLKIGDKISVGTKAFSPTIVT